MQRHSNRLLYGLAVILAMFVPGAIAQPVLQGGTDHFKCYEAIDTNSNAPATISLTDQWGTLSNVAAMTPLELCNPVAKTVAGATTPIDEPDAHLVFYALTQKLPAHRRKVVINNQFGLQTLRTAAPKLVAVPTVKNNVGSLGAVEDDLSHFTCYEASGKRLLINTGLVDQFDNASVAALVHAPQFFCNPAVKTRENESTVIDRDEDHLVCYKVTPSTAPPAASSTVGIENQFETDTLKVGPTHFLCVPSQKVSFTD